MQIMRLTVDCAWLIWLNPPVMRTFQLPNRRKPFTAQQYINHCEARKNRIACARLDFRDACIRTAWILAALILLSIAAGGAIHSAILLSH